MSDLKPCPFCGGEAAHIPLNYVIGCQPCGVWMTDDRKDEWNRRTQPEATAPAQDLSAAILALPCDKRVDDFQAPLDCNLYVLGFIAAKDAAAAVAKARVEGWEFGYSQSKERIEEVQKENLQLALRAERAEAALAQPVDLSKLTRYGFDGTLGGDFGKNNLGPYVKLSDVEQLLAAAPAAPVAEQKWPESEAFKYINQKVAEQMSPASKVAQPQPVAEQEDLPPLSAEEEAICAAIEEGVPAHARILRTFFVQRRAASQQAAEPVSNNHRWPFAETPGEFADRLRVALPKFAGDLLPALRNVIIEQGVELVVAPAIQQPQDERATAAEAKLKAIRETVKSLVGYGDEHASFISRANVLALFEPKPQADESGLPG